MFPENDILKHMLGLEYLLGRQVTPGANKYGCQNLDVLVVLIFEVLLFI